MSNILVMSSKISCKFVAESACILLVLLCVLLPIGWGQIAIAGPQRLAGLMQGHQ